MSVSLEVKFFISVSTSSLLLSVYTDKENPKA